MTLADVTKKWLSPAVDHKERAKRRGERTERGRLPIGEKGVGRFAAHQIGQRLHLITKVEDQPEVVVELDWNDFEGDEYLEDVEVVIQERDPEIFPRDATGTILRIMDSRQPWNKPLLKKVHRTFRRLQSPLEQEQDDFSITLSCPQYPQYTNIDPTDILERAHYVLRAYVDEEGGCDFEYQCMHPGTDPREEILREENLKNVAGDELQGKAPECGPFHFTLYVWDRTAQYLREAGVSRDELDAHSGVSLFRDGLRVLPYGEPGDDWLFLDQERIQAPAERLSNNQVIGFVEVKQEENLQLRDKTNREGLIENDAFLDLRALVRAAIRLFTTGFWIEDKAVDRNNDDPSDEQDEGNRTTITRAHTIAEALRESADEERRVEIPSTGDHGGGQQASSADPSLSMTVSQREAVELLIDQLTGAEESLSEREHRLDVLLHLAATGLSSERLVHEVGRQAQAALDAVGDLRPVVRGSGVGTDALEVIDSALQALRNEFRVLAPYEAVRRSQATGDVSVRTAAEIARDLNRMVPVAAGISIDVEGEDFEVRARQASLVQVLDNLVNNAIYWAPRGNSGDEPRVLIRTDPQRRRVLVADSGPGVHPSIAGRMFEPFTTLKPQGRGLGLFICLELMGDIDGELHLAEDGQDEDVPAWANGAVFVLEFGSDGEGS